MTMNRASLKMTLTSVYDVVLVVLVERCIISFWVKSFTPPPYDLSKKSTFTSFDFLFHFFSLCLESWGNSIEMKAGLNERRNEMKKRRFFSQSVFLSSFIIDFMKFHSPLGSHASHCNEARSAELYSLDQFVTSTCNLTIICAKNLFL